MKLRRCVVFVPLAAAVITLAAACQSSSTENVTPSPTAAASVRQLGPNEFRDAMAAESGFVLNVHTPYEGEIDGTDGFIPFDAITERAAELPQDKDEPIFVYCRSGRMSAQAIPALQQLGYTRIIELAGGMNAWREAGLPIMEQSS